MGGGVPEAGSGKDDFRSTLADEREDADSGVAESLEASQEDAGHEGGQVVNVDSGNGMVASGKDSKTMPSLRIEAHVQDRGWLEPVGAGIVAGTTGKNLNLEGLRVYLDGAPGSEVMIRAHVSSIGWQDWINQGEAAGTVGKNLPIEAIQISLTGSAMDEFDVWYRMHSADFDSNLALALFDIILHLTDKERILQRYFPYLCLNSQNPVAEFEYEFSFNGVPVVYRYGKSDPLTLTYEQLLIGGREVLQYDFESRSGVIALAGAESLALSSELPAETDRLSRVKYVKNNAMLQDSEANRVFVSFTTFVDNMLMFYSLDERGYQGLSVGPDSFTQGIIREGKIEEFRQFLEGQGILYDLVSVDVNGSPELYCKYDGGVVPFGLVASTGTKSLALYFYWVANPQSKCNDWWW